MRTLDTRLTNRDIFDYSVTESKTANEINIHFIGFILYIAFFVITVPYILYKGGQKTLLEAYMPNVDMLATVLSFVGGPFGMFDELYVPNPRSQSEFIYQTTINFVALLGLTYLVARETYVNKSIPKGWSIAFIMIIVTYLVPSQFISKAMTEQYRSGVSIYAVTIVGFLVAISFILAERLLLVTLRDKLAKFAEFLTSL